MVFSHKVLVSFFFVCWLTPPLRNALSECWESPWKVRSADFLGGSQCSIAKSTHAAKQTIWVKSIVPSFLRALIFLGGPCLPWTSLDMHIYMCVYIYAYTYIHTGKYIFTHIYTHICIYVRIFKFTASVTMLTKRSGRIWQESSPFSKNYCNPGKGEASMRGEKWEWEHQRNA